jgi:hypothetical protein
VKVANANGTVVVDARFLLDSNLAPGDGANLTLLKASGSATDVCLQSVEQSVVPGVSVRGSLSNLADVRRAAGFACSEQIGSNIQVDEAGLNGALKKTLGNYVLPDQAIVPAERRLARGLGTSAKGQKVVIPVECLVSGKVTTYVTQLAQDSIGAQIRVDDIGLTAGCQY